MAKGDGGKPVLKDSAKTYGVRGAKFVGRNGGKAALMLLGGAGKLGLKTIDAIGRHDGFQTALAIGGVTAAAIALSPLVLAGVGGAVALKFVSDKLSGDPTKNSKGILTEFLDIARFGGNIVGKAHEHILAPALSRGNELIEKGQNLGKDFLDEKLGKDDDGRGDV